jgi:hypothetical protein
MILILPSTSTINLILEYSEREYFYGVLGTIVPDYLGSLIRHDNAVRNKPTEAEMTSDIIEVDLDILRKINDEPFLSSKCQLKANLLEIRGHSPY